MRKSQIEAMALTAMRDAMAKGKRQPQIVQAGSDTFARFYASASIAQCDADATALWDDHFEVMVPN